MTPIKVKMTNWEMTKNAKYLATTDRSSLECVVAPMYWDNHRMMMGKKNPKIPDTVGGNTPEMKANENGDELDHDSRKGTYVLIYGKIY